jgi:hypothetical protein
MVVSGSSWFRDWNETPAMPGGDVRRSSMIIAVTGDASGRIWINGVHAPDNWTPQELPQGVYRDPSGGLAGSREAMEEYLDMLHDHETESVIEVVSPVQRSVLTTLKMPGTVQLLTSSIGYRYRTDSDGNTTIEILSFLMVP